MKNLNIKKTFNDGYLDITSEDGYLDSPLRLSHKVKAQDGYLD